MASRTCDVMSCPSLAMNGSKPDCKQCAFASCSPQVLQRLEPLRAGDALAGELADKACLPRGRNTQWHSSCSPIPAHNAGRAIMGIESNTIIVSWGQPVVLPGCAQPMGQGAAALTTRGSKSLGQSLRCATTVGATCSTSSKRTLLWRRVKQAFFRWFSRGARGR